jgi:hypothetical protein
VSIFRIDSRRVVRDRGGSGGFTNGCASNGVEGCSTITSGRSESRRYRCARITATSMPTGLVGIRSRRPHRPLLYRRSAERAQVAAGQETACSAPRTRRSCSSGRRGIPSSTSHALCHTSYLRDQGDRQHGFSRAQGPGVLLLQWVPRSYHQSAAHRRCHTGDALRSHHLTGGIPTAVLPEPVKYKYLLIGETDPNFQLYLSNGFVATVLRQANSPGLDQRRDHHRGTRTRRRAVHVRRQFRQAAPIRPSSLSSNILLFGGFRDTNGCGSTQQFFNYSTRAVVITHRQDRGRSDVALALAGVPTATGSPIEYYRWAVDIDDLTDETPRNPEATDLNTGARRVSRPSSRCSDRSSRDPFTRSTSSATTVSRAMVVNDRPAIAA